MGIVRENKEFWWVWTKSGHRPTKFHLTEAKAEAEAERLAKANPGRKFIVLHAYTKIHAEPEITNVVNVTNIMTVSGEAIAGIRGVVEGMVATTLAKHKRPGGALGL